mmetsp:Transcript_4368/g.6385  ORF Transcript_4368/g.6385 Transcript_4368/m.6385 type:complete len:95 (-) Transcript_4368:803-1087(-)
MGLPLLKAKDGRVQADFIHVTKIQNDKDEVVVRHYVIGDTFINGMGEATMIRQELLSFVFLHLAEVREEIDDSEGRILLEPEFILQLLKHGDSI